MKSKIAVLSLIFPLLTAMTLSACKSTSSRDQDAQSGENSSPREANPLVPLSWGPNYRYNELLTKDYDEMLAMVQGLVKKARQATSKEDGSNGDAEAVEYYGRALKLIFSRPDSDNMVTKLVSEIRRDLQGFNSYEDVIAGIAAEAIRLAKNEQAAVIVQSTALVELENIMAEIRPEVNNGNTYMRDIVKTIRDADLKMSDEVKRDRRLRGMFKTKNPSEEARDLLRALYKKKK
jgi:hypothetical protein